MAVNDPKLKIEITADSRSAQRAVTGLYNDVNKLGGSFTASFGGAIPMAGAAAAAIAGIATAAIGVGSAIFDMTKAASEYGSAIFDATEKTGLSAEVMSSFKVAAEQSGSSLEVVTGGLAKFAKTIGAAGDGSEEAQKKLAKIGVTSNDLETALGQALKTIAKYPPGVQQMTAAQAAFGKSGADLLPFIKSFDGDLPGLIAKMKELGITMSDQDAKAADEFGDTLDTLTKQAAATGRQFAMEMMPAITNAMKAISGVITDNQSAVHVWGNSVGEAVRGVQTVFRLLDGQVQLSFQAINYLFGVNMKATVNWAQFIFDTALPVLKLLREIATIGGGVSDSIATATDTASGIVTRRAGARMPDMPDLGGGGGGKAGKSGESAADKAAREAEERRRKAVQAAEKEMQQLLAIYTAGYKERIAALDQALSTGAIVELQHVRDTSRVRLEAIMDEITLTTKLSQNENLNDEERAEILQKIKVLTIELRVEKIKGSTEANEQIKKEVKAQTELLEIEQKRLDAIKKIRMQKKADADAERIQELRRRRNRGGEGYDFGLGGLFKDFSDQVLTNGPKMEEVLQSLGDIGMSAFNSLAQGMGSMIESWVLMGDMGPKAMQKLVASVLAGVAAQSAVLAIFELAKGFAALWLNPAEAATHFKAAALFGVVAVGAALAGRAVAGNAFKPESNESSNGNNRSSSANENMNPYSRASATAYYSGQQSEIRQLSNEISKFRKQIGSMKPGDVLTAGARQRPGFFATQTGNDIARNSSLGSRILRNAGVR